jgi:hypothetical protein
MFSVKTLHLHVVDRKCPSKVASPAKPSHYLEHKAQLAQDSRTTVEYDRLVFSILVTILEALKPYVELIIQNENSVYLRGL